MAPKRLSLVSWLTAAALAALIGCTAQTTQGPRRLVEAQNEVLRLTDENKKLTKDLFDARQTIERQTDQIATLQKLGGKRFEELTHVDSIKLDRLTSGYHDDEHPYDDGVVVYIQAADAQGTVLKAAGIVRVRLFELQDEPRLVGQIKLDPKELEKAWIGRFWTHHYTVKVPFTKPPISRNITVHVDFTELLTGRTFTAETMVEVKLPTTATAPAAATMPAK